MKNKYLKAKQLIKWYKLIQSNKIFKHKLSIKYRQMSQKISLKGLDNKEKMHLKKLIKNDS